MKLHRPRSLNGLILVGFGLVALPLLFAVIWALFNFDRFADQSEQLFFTGFTAAENNRRLEENLSSLERVARQYQVLQNPESLQLMAQDLVSLEAQLREMAPLISQAGASELASSIGATARSIIAEMSDTSLDEAQLAAAIERFAPLRQRVSNLTDILTNFVDAELSALQETARKAQRYSAWQVWSPGRSGKSTPPSGNSAKAVFRSPSRSRDRPISSASGGSWNGCACACWNLHRKRTSSCATCRMS